MPMRILIYSYNYSPEPIGIGPLMTELAEGLAARGHQVRVVTALPWYPVDEKFPKYDHYRGIYLEERMKGVLLQRCQVYRSKKRNLLNRGLFELGFMVLSFFQAIRGNRPDVVLLTVPGLPVGVPASVLGWLFRCPIVLNLQDILPDAAVKVGLLKNQLAIKVFKALENYNYWISERITVISEAFTHNLHQKQVNPEKITLIPNWVNENFIYPISHAENKFRMGQTYISVDKDADGEERQVLPLQKRFEQFVHSLSPQHQDFRANYSLQDKFIVLYSGNIGLTQPLWKMIKAAKLLEHIPAIHFVVVGPEAGLRDLWDCCQRMEIKDNVTLSPFVDRRDLPMLLTAANVSLVIQKSNVVSFNMPSKIQTISASGRAIIASVPRQGTAAKAILDSRGGVWVPPDDVEALAQTIHHLYSNPEEVEQLGKNARQYALEHYSLRKAIERYEELFESAQYSFSRMRSVLPKPPYSSKTQPDVTKT